MPPRLSRQNVRTAGSLTLRAVLISTLLASVIAPTLASSSVRTGVATTTLPDANTSTPVPIATNPSANTTPDRSPPDESQPMCQHYGENGFSIENSAMLFSRDNDQLRGDGWTREDYVANCGHEPTWATNYTLEFDYTRHQAFPQVATWNKKDIDDIPFPTPRAHTALYPEGESTISAGYLETGSASVYSVSPSVALRDEHRGGTTLLIRDETTIRGAQSYRVRLPRGLDRTEGPTHVYYDISGHRVVGSCLLEGGFSHAAGYLKQEKNETLCFVNEPLATASGLKSPVDPGPKDRRKSGMTIDYATGMDETLSYVSTFKYTVTKRVTRCTDWDYRNETCDGEYEFAGFSSRTRYTSAVDDLNVRYYSQPTPKAEVARYPDGDTEFVLEARNTYGYRLGWDALFSKVVWTQDDISAGWTWRIFSARRPEWTHLVRDTHFTRTIEESPTHSLQNYAVPVAASTEDVPGTGLATGGDVEVQGILRSSPPITTPSIDNRILVAAPEPEYRLPYAVQYRADEYLDFSEARVVGLLDGTNTTGVYVEREVDIRETNLTTHLADAGNNKYELIVTLRGVRNTSRGPVRLPLSTTDKRSYVTVNGERVQTNSEGNATVLVEEGATVTVEYHPVAWTSHRRDVAYLGSEAWVRTSSFGASFLLQLVSELVVLFFPFILVLVTLRSIARNKPNPT